MHEQINAEQNALIEFPELTIKQAREKKVRYFTCQKACSCGDKRRVFIGMNTPECYSCSGQFHKIVTSASKQKVAAGNDVSFNGRLIFRLSARGFR